ncbi:hypothetical protein [Streptomyces sp. NRRL S-1022]|uniref:hypothetical protein n=1 Tax=Streptomyces sp. NRRL S-1022 TaxID=1463880 RepID=UPI0004BEAF85|nr:hypothetical protein [Streptomyces sp. NRRL S-1022]
MITHDLNLAPDADRIVVVERGGAYARLHRSQNSTPWTPASCACRCGRNTGHRPYGPGQAYGQGQGHGYGYGSEAGGPAYGSAGHVPSALPDGRPLFRNEEVWPGS